MLKYIVRALRLPFLAASLLPFAFGSLISRRDFNIPAFFLGLITVACTHLSANLINDYADSKSGVDWQDKKFYQFFGGSKLIQEKILTENFYLYLSIILAVASFLCAIALAIILSTSKVAWLYLCIICLSWFYSVKPLRFSYRMSGELIIFLLFGPALVMGGYFIQSGIFPDIKSLLLSLPFGFFTAAILFVNEVPDFTQDKNAGKHTWVNFCGPQNAYLVYGLIMLSGFFAIAIGITRGYLGPIAYLSFIFIFLSVKAVKILKRDFIDKIKLIKSSRLTILIQAAIGIILLLDSLL